MKRTFIFCALSAIVTFSSCQKDAVIEPTQTNSGAPDAATYGRTPLTPRLVKYGETTFKYDNEGRLSKMTSFNGQVERTYQYTDTEQSFVAKQDDKPVATVKYQLNAKGICTSISMNRIIYNGYDGKVLSNNTYNYSPSYNANNQLIKIERQVVAGLPAFRYEFSYNADGNLSETRLFENNVLKQRHTYSYNQPYAGELQVDKDPWNPTLPQSLNPAPIEAYLMDRHLDVFGTFRKHLIRSMKQEVSGTITTNQYYKYKFGDNGYLTAQDIYDGVTNAYKGTALFEYKTPFIVIPNLL